MIAILQAFIMILCAWLFDWSPTQLIWSFWLASLASGYLTLISMIVFEVIQTKKMHKGASAWIEMTIGLTIFETFTFVHYTMFHLGHAVFLGFLFPLIDPELSNSANRSIPEHAQMIALLSLWPSAAIAVISTAHAHWRAYKAVPTLDSGKLQSGMYGGVIRIHVLIIALMVLKSSNASMMVIYQVIVLAFLPYESLLRRNLKTPAPAARDDGRDKAA